MRDKGRLYIAAGASLLLALSLGAAALTAGGGSATVDKLTPPPTATQADAIRPPASCTPEPWSSNSLPDPAQLLDVSLDQETQREIYHECGYDSGLFCTVMAIAYRETGGTFQADAVGDNGDSIGMFQINTRWHTDRLERLGVTDLTNPAQCAAVAIDYLEELAEDYGFPWESHDLLMAYSMGPGGAKKALAAGTASTAYSREVLELYQGFMKEMEA